MQRFRIPGNLAGKILLKAISQLAFYKTKELGEIGYANKKINRYCQSSLRAMLICCASIKGDLDKWHQQKSHMQKLRIADGRRGKHK